MAAIAAALAGCGLGPGSRSEGTATLTVTRDYGAQAMVEATLEDPAETETALKLLDREAEVETRYGGGFVQSIDGVSGSTEDGRRHDWFFYVNGVESPVGSAERDVAGGDRVWWDHRDWTDAMRVPAVVGEWPEPFLQASAGEAERLPVRVECNAQQRSCEQVLQRLDDEGVSVSEVRSGAGPGEALRVIVGSWAEIGDDRAAAQLDEGPGESGVFARFEAGGRELVALDEEAQPEATLGRGAGLVAAVRDGDAPPAWLVTGVDGAGVRAAAEALAGDVLGHRYAVVVASNSDDALAVPAVDTP